MSNLEADLKAWKHWWIHTRDQAESTIDQYAKHVRAYTAEYGDTLSVRPANEYVAETCQRSRSVGAWAWRALRSFARWLEEVEDEPATGLLSKRFSRPTPPTVQHNHVATASDLAAMLATCDEGTPTLFDRRDHAILSTLASTGARLSEVQRMRWEDLSEDLSRLRIPKTKNGDVRYPRLSGDAQTSLRRYLRAISREYHGERPPYCWLAYGMERQISSDGIRQMITARAKVAGVPVTAHTFRRGLAVSWLRGGGSETHLRQACGWRTTQMVARYMGRVADDEAFAEHERLFG